MQFALIKAKACEIEEMAKGSEVASDDSDDE
jgi:hypothetical protein